MNISTLVILILLTVSFNTFPAQQSLAQSFSDTTCDKNCENFSDIISTYRIRLAASPLSYKLTAENDSGGVKVKQYYMQSQMWSPDNGVRPATWEHQVEIYLPPNPEKRSALMVINNGINSSKDLTSRRLPSDFSPEALRNIAMSSHTIVISISNIPNQYLYFGSDAGAVKEDDAVARSWEIFLKDPKKNSQMPLHIPMAVAVSQAIRLAKTELRPWNINKFVLTGTSKRGWTAWLTTLSDPDVVALVPFVFDLLNTKLTLAHMYHSYGDNWPIAFRAYYQQGIDKAVGGESFSKLAKIEDPLQYTDMKYRERMLVPKYIINASGDDFYVPDNSRFYYGQLPGVKSLRVVPNTDHYGINKSTEQSVISFLNRYQNEQALPVITETLDEHRLTVNFSEVPIKILRWTAVNNKARDFRFACNVRYLSTPVRVTDKRVSILLNDRPAGWEATYLEATFRDGFVATTQVYVIPDRVYPHTPPLSAGPACQTLPGRGIHSH